MVCVVSRAALPKLKREGARQEGNGMETGSQAGPPLSRVAAAPSLYQAPSALPSCFLVGDFSGSFSSGLLFSGDLGFTVGFFSLKAVLL